VFRGEKIIAVRRLNNHHLGLSATAPASMQFVASRDGKLELPTPNSQAGAWELALNPVVSHDFIRHSAPVLVPTQRVGTSTFSAIPCGD